MEVFFHDVDFRATLKDVKYVFANVLHSPSFLPQSAPPWNFHVSLFPPKKNRSVQPHGGCGIVTVPQEDLGHRLLRSFGGNIRLSVLGRRIKLKPGKGTPRDTILEKIRHEPYLSPEVQQRREEIEQSFLQNAVGIHTVQLGWETRREVFSVEWEKCVPGDCHLVFDNSRREIRMKIKDQPGIVRTIAVHWSQVSWSATGCTDETDPTPTIFLSLFSPPVFDIELSHDILGVLGLQSPNSVKRQRLLELYPDDADLKRVLPYATLCIRLLCPRSVDLKTFKRLCKIARIPAPKDFAYQAEKLALFSETRLEEYRQWTSTLDWPVAFQLEALLRGRVADTKEVLSIRHIIDNMVEQEGTNYTANFLRSLADDTFFEVQGHDEGAFEATIEQYAENFSWSQSPQPRNPKDGIFNCLHVYISPTSMKLGGPFPERSNRVLRTYADNHDSFIRVSFAEENDSRYQHDREIDGEAFIRLWVSPLLRDGITVAGRNFNFLAYSQSALKSHTVWFMKDFVNPRGESINAATIIERLGNFDNLAYDPNLIRCPARYAARISQAFTTTDSSVSVPTDEIFIEDDIMSESGQYCFTDGVGTISSDLAQKIWRALQRRGIRATRKAITYPRAFQIRLVGAKGMLSVDHKLSGDVVILRRSMIKFDAPHSTDVEIAQPFVRPSRYYLNRPLIMILEGLGVPYGVFQDLQDEAVRNVEDAVTSLEKAANTLDQFGLAASYRVSSTLLHLSEIGISPRLMGDFYDLMLSYAIHHILRDLKHYARIPVDDGYTLVGVADIHGYLKEGEVFACVTIQETNSIEYLEGPVLVSRSPVIHPGDVQVVRAIGQPPVGSPFQKEPLMNTIVFSIHGSRPLPSCLGGGDLDGDMYNVTFLRDLHPTVKYTPAPYDPAPRKLLDRPSTVDDVTDFVADYINNDILGMVAVNWLIMADQEGIFNEDCLKLCQIHSNAVDYPKSGTPVALDSVPRPRMKMKPDWNAPETVNLEISTDFYQSNKAIGRLFRAINLPPVHPRTTAARRRRQHLHDDTSEADSDLDELFAEFCMVDQQEDPLELAVKHRVAEFIPVEPNSRFVKLAMESLNRYSIELQGICSCNTLQRQKAAILSEEEAVIGTIVAKCSRRGRRKEAIGQLREQTGHLVKYVRDELSLSGDDDSSEYEWLESAWAAWEVSRYLKDRFGAHSYGWIALSEVFDAIKAIEE